MAKKLRKGLIDTNIFILSFNLSFEAIDMIDLFGLMISSGHMQVLNIDAFPGDECEHALNRERASIDKIAIIEVLAFISWVAV
jgi:hypothetical protein